MSGVRIGAWAWGLRRALDVLVDEPRIDGQRVVGRRALPPWKGGVVGGRAGRALRHGGLEQLRLRGSGTVPPPGGRDGRRHHAEVPALVLFGVRVVRRQRGDAARRPAPVARSDRTTSALRRERAGGHLGRSARGVPRRVPRVAGLPDARGRRARSRRDACRFVARHQPDRLPHPSRRARDDGLRLGPVRRRRRPPPQPRRDEPGDDR